jgi:hypothetical protein
MHELHIRCKKTNPADGVIVNTELRLLVRIEGYFPMCRIKQVLEADERKGTFEILLDVLHLNQIQNLSLDTGKTVELLYPVHNSLWATCELVGVREIEEKSGADHD